jgi:type IV pilus assembly protein PilB
MMPDGADRKLGKRAARGVTIAMNFGSGNRLCNDPIGTMTELPKRLRLGDMLTLAGIVSPADVEEALGIQKGSGRRLGEVLVSLGKVTEHQLAQVLSNQLSIPWVNLHHVDFSRELLNLVPADLAEKAAIVPVYVRKVRNHGDTLFVATDDPMNDASLALVAAHVGMPVKPMVAGSSDVRGAVRAYYGRELPGPAPRAEKKPLIASIPPVEDPEVIVEEEEIEIRMSGVPSEPTPAAPEVAAAESAPAEEKASEEKPKKKRSGPKMITLTLLDGTKVRLPAPGGESSEEAHKQLTTRDLIAALIARTQGKDVSKVLPDAQWEPLFATLLSLLMRKGLVADWEFVEEWGKHRARK